MKFKLFFCLVLLVMLQAGCANKSSSVNSLASTPPQNIDTQATLQKIAACKAQKLTKKNAVEREECIDRAVLHLTGLDNRSNFAESFVSSNRLLAIDYSEGKISKKRFEALLSQNASRFDSINGEEQARQQQMAYQQQMLMAQQQALEAQRTQNIMNSLTALDRTLNPPPPPHPTITNCHQMGAFMNCLTQ